MKEEAVFPPGSRPEEGIRKFVATKGKGIFCREREKEGEAGGKGRKSVRKKAGFHNPAVDKRGKSCYNFIVGPAPAPRRRKRL